MPEITEGKYAGEYVVSEANGSRSREVVTILSGQNVVAGEVLGKITQTAAVAAAVAGNTGNGTMGTVTKGALVEVGVYDLECIAAPSGAITTPATGTADGGNAGANTMGSVSAGAAVKAGTYTMTCTDATNAGAEVFQVTDPDGLLLPPATVAVAYVNAQINFTIADPGANAQVGDAFTVLASAADGNVGTFSVFTPSGERLPDLTVAAAYATDHISMTLADGATDFVVGDAFTVTISAGSLKYVALDQDGTDGRQIAAGIAFDNYDATSADVEGVITARDTEVNGAELSWPSDIEAGEQITAETQLAALGIIVR